MSMLFVIHVQVIRKQSALKSHDQNLRHGFVSTSTDFGGLSQSPIIYCVTGDDANDEELIIRFFTRRQAEDFVVAFEKLITRLYDLNVFEVTTQIQRREFPEHLVKQIIKQPYTWTS